MTRVRTDVSEFPAWDVKEQERPCHELTTTPTDGGGHDCRDRCVWGMFGWPVPASEQAGWEVTDLDTGHSLAPDIAVDEGGSAIAVWESAQHIRAATFAAATELWSQPITLSNPVDFTSGPRVASNAAGDAVAVWTGTRSSNATTYLALSRYSAATKTWDNALELPAKGLWPRAVIDGQGNITVVWAEFLRISEESYYDEEVHELRSVRYDAATASWSSPVILSGEYAWLPELGIDGAGNVTVVWWTWWSGFIESARWSSGTGGWSDVRRLSSSSAYYPQIVVDTRGDVTAVWNHYTPSRTLHAARYSADIGTWGPPVLVAAPSDHNTSLGVDATGNVTVVYATNPGGFPPGPSTLRSVSYLRASNSWSVPEDIATNAGFEGGKSPSILMEMPQPCGWRKTELYGPHDDLPVVNGLRTPPQGDYPTHRESRPTSSATSSCCGRGMRRRRLCKPLA